MPWNVSAVWCGVDRELLCHGMCGQYDVGWIENYCHGLCMQ